MCLSGHYLERGIKGLHGFMSDLYAESPHYLVRVPPSMRPIAVLVEPLSFIEKGIEQALRIQQRLVYEPGHALVLGAGPIGLLAGLVLTLRGLRVTMASRGAPDRPAARLAEDAGMRYVSTEATPVDRIPALVGPIDLLFESTGAASVVMPAIGALGLNGICILGSVTAGQKKTEVDVAAFNQSMVLGNRVVFGAVTPPCDTSRRRARPGDRAGPVPRLRLERMITRRLPVEDARQALRARAERHQVRSAVRLKAGT
jgi:threonine dehydrogenase-like Zn-dependent dehydrogenase